MMEQKTGPSLEPVPRDDHVLRPLLRWSEEHPGRPAAAYRDGDRFVDVTWKEQRDRVWALARGLVGSGVQPGDRVALMAHTRIEWPVVDAAITAAGGVTVPVYETSAAEQLQWMLADSGAVLAIVETPAMGQLYDQVADAVPSCREVLVIEDGGLDELARRGVDVDAAEVDRRVAQLDADRVATIIYTSGTTGRPKGCTLTHGNLRANVVQNLDALGPLLQGDQRSLLFLPLAHALAKIVLLVGQERGIKGMFATDMLHLAEELPLAQPTTIVAVPRVFEKAFDAARHRARSRGRVAGALFAKGAEVAIRSARERAAGRARRVTALQHAVFDRLVYRKVRAAFGGDLRSAVSGGAPLGERLTLFFDGVGTRVLEGYGLTETGPVLTVNRPGAWKPGTVGRPVAGTTIRIAEDGEILARGPQVFQGYWNDPQATRAVVDDDGWFHTGDIGTLDDDGFLRVTGRVKDLIVTAAGKNVAAAPLEDQINAHELVSQTMVVGDGRPFVAALLTLDEAAAARWTAEHGRPDHSLAQLATDEELRAELQGAVDAANRTVSRAESIRKFTVLPRDLTVDAGELTPTLKLRRAVVEEVFADEIRALYGS